MTSASADVTRQLPNLWQHFDAGQAAQQIASVATDLGCAVDSVCFVLRELSKVNMTATTPFCSFIATTPGSLSIRSAVAVQQTRQAAATSRPAIPPFPAGKSFLGPGIAETSNRSHPGASSVLCKVFLTCVLLLAPHTQL